MNQNCPARSSRSVEIGTILQGRDDNYWIVKKNENNKIKWVQYKNKDDPENIYYTHDNGSRPLCVRIIDTSINIYKWTSDGYYEYAENTEDDEFIDDGGYKWLLEIAPYEKVFIGSDTDSTEFSEGNSILIKKNKKKYVYAGHEIYTFTPIDKIIKYWSPIGNNDVPEPCAIGKDNIYSMAEKVMISKSVSGYPYYGINKSNLKKMTVKIIHKRNNC
jgi:hypothetical protein